MGKTGSPGSRSPGMSKAGLNVMLAPKQYKPRWDWALGLEPGTGLDLVPLSAAPWELNATFSALSPLYCFQSISQTASQF